MTHELLIQQLSFNSYYYPSRFVIQISVCVVQLVIFVDSFFVSHLLLLYFSAQLSSPWVFLTFKIEIIQPIHMS